MRLLITTTFASLSGGVETYLVRTVSELSRRGVDVRILSTYKPNQNGDLFFSLDMKGWYWNHQSSESILKEIYDWIPGAVYSHGMGDPGPEATISKLYPTVYFNHNYGGACASGTKLLTIPGYQVCSNPLGTACLAAWMFRRCGGLNPISFFRFWRRERAREVIFSQARAVCVASHHMRSVMVQNGVPESKVRLLPLFPPNGDREPVPPAPRSFANQVLFAGRLTRLKGWTHLVPAIAMASRALARRLTLVVAGDGPDRDRLVRLATKWNVPLDFRGWLEPKPLKTLMGQVDLLAVPSLWPEPFGLVGIEAGCVGTPAVAYGVGGIPDWLVPGVSGELAPGDDLRPKPLADAIVRALRDADHWQRLREGAWRQAGLFSRESHMERLLSILQEAAASR